MAGDPDSRWWKVEPDELKDDTGSDLAGPKLEQVLYGKMIVHARAFLDANVSDIRARTKVSLNAIAKMTDMRLYGHVIGKVEKVPTGARALKAVTYHGMATSEWNALSHALMDLQVAVSVMLARPTSSFKTKVEEEIIGKLTPVLAFEPFNVILSYTEDIMYEASDTLAMGDILKALPPTLATHATRAMHETAAGKSTNTVFMGNQLTDNFDSTRCLPFLISAQREGATYQEVKQMVAKHKELSSLLQSELLACKPADGKTVTENEKKMLTESFLTRAIKWASPSASARELRDQVLNFRQMSEGEAWRDYFNAFREKLEMTRMACQMEGIDPDSIENDRTLCVMLRSKLTPELRKHQAIKESTYDEMGEMGQEIKDKAYDDLYDFFRYIDRTESAINEGGKGKVKPSNVPTGRYSANFQCSVCHPPSHDAMYMNPTHAGGKATRLPAEVFPDRGFPKEMPWPPPGGCLEKFAFGICRKPTCKYNHQIETYAEPAQTHIGAGTQVHRWALPRAVPPHVRKELEADLKTTNEKKQDKGKQNTRAYAAAIDYDVPINRA